MILLSQKYEVVGGGGRMVVGIQTAYCNDKKTIQLIKILRK